MPSADLRVSSSPYFCTPPAPPAARDSPADFVASCFCSGLAPARLVIQQLVSASSGPYARPGLALLEHVGVLFPRLALTEYMAIPPTPSPSQVRPRVHL